MPKKDASANSKAPKELIDPASFALRLKSRRQQLGISIRGLAEKAKVAQSTVFRLEAGDYHIQFDTLLKVLEQLNLSPDELLGTKPTEKAISSAEEKLLEYLADPAVKDVVAKLSALILPVKRGKR